MKIGNSKLKQWTATENGKVGQELVTGNCKSPYKTFVKLVESQKKGMRETWKEKRIENKKKMMRSEGLSTGVTDTRAILQDQERHSHFP